MKKKYIDLNFFFDLWRIKISTTCKKPHISIVNIYWVILKKLIKTTLNFWKSGNKPLSLFFPRGRGHAEIIFWVWDIYRTRSNSFYIFAPHRFPSPLNINSTSQHQADRKGTDWGYVLLPEVQHTTGLRLNIIYYLQVRERIYDGVKWV